MLYRILGATGRGNKWRRTLEEFTITLRLGVSSDTKTHIVNITAVAVPPDIILRTEPWGEKESVATAIEV